MSTAPTTRIGLIGASGFVGLRTTEILGARADLALIPIVRQPSSLAVLARQRLEWRITSFVDAEALATALQGCTVCVHAAIGDAAQIVRMAEAAYRACAKAGVKRLVWLSSASVHGQNCPPGTDDFSALHDHHPLVYNNAKVRAERVLQRLTRDGRVQVVSLRPGVVYGPRSRWIADAAAEIRAGRVGWINGGRGICNGIYIDNLVEAIRLAAIAPAPLAGAYLVGDAETVTWREFLLPIARHFGRDESNFAELPTLPIVAERENRLSALTMTPAYGKFRRLLPERLLRVTKGVLRAWRPPAHSAGAWTLRAAARAPHLTAEMSLLQQCEWKFPHTRAAGDFGYAPPVTFAEGMRRSLAWLDFAEGR